MTPEPAAEHPSLHVPRLVLAWCVALGLVLAVIFLLPADQRYEWLIVAIGACVLLSFVLQLGTAQREGFITRLSLSVIGSAMIVGVAQVVDRVVMMLAGA